ncbi:SDR family NAD(P)-dependent oxidoreductase [Methanosarcina mazei]|nr:SDR family NAD(P)-dependent oxidoreductase [Methanosarcina mazei]
MNEGFNGKTVLVTGGTGSIGSEIVKQVLTYEVKKVIVFSRDEIKHLMFKKKIQDERLEMIIGDVRDINSIMSVFDRFKIDIIYHAAAMKHVIVSEKYPNECAKTNINGTQNIIDLAVKYNVPQLVTISTDKAASPVNVMGCTKYIAEMITLNSNYSCVRFGNVANSRGSVIPVFIDSMLKDKKIIITDPEVTRFMFTIPDAVKLVIKATNNTKGGDLFILKMKAFRLGDLLDVMLDRIAPRLGMSKEEIMVDEIGLVPGEKLHEELVNESEINRIYELDDMYIILKDNQLSSIYGDLSKAELKSYGSNDVELITKDELEKIVTDYLYIS